MKIKQVIEAMKSLGYEYKQDIITYYKTDHVFKNKDKASPCSLIIFACNGLITDIHCGLSMYHMPTAASFRNIQINVPARKFIYNTKAQRLELEL